MEKYLTPKQTDEIVKFCKRQGYNFYRKYKGECDERGLEPDDIVGEMCACFFGLNIDIQKKFFDGATGYINTILWNAIREMIRKTKNYVIPKDETAWKLKDGEEADSDDIESIIYDKATDKTKYIDDRFDERDTRDKFINIIETLNDVERKFIICKICLNAADSLVAKYYWNEFKGYVSELTKEQKQMLADYKKDDYTNDIIFRTFFGQENGTYHFSAGQRAVRNLKNKFNIK